MTDADRLLTAAVAGAHAQTESDGETFAAKLRDLADCYDPYTHDAPPTVAPAVPVDPATARVARRELGLVLAETEDFVTESDVARAHDNLDNTLSAGVER